MSEKLLRQFIQESMQDRSFIEHMKNGLGYARGNTHAEAYQIADDWVTDAELRMENLLHPGRVTQIERFVVAQWPIVLEQYHGNQTLALIAMNNLLDAKFNDKAGGL